MLSMVIAAVFASSRSRNPPSAWNEISSGVMCSGQLQRILLFSTSSDTPKVACEIGSPVVRSARGTGTGSSYATSPGTPVGCSNSTWYEIWTEI